MGFRKKAIILLTLLFTAAAGILFWKEQRDIPLTFTVSAGEHTEQLSVWGQAWGEYFVFLPSYGELSQVRLHTGLGRSVRFDDLTLKNGGTCGQLELDRPYRIFGATGEIPSGSTVTFVRSQNVPAMFIDTVSGSMDFVHKQKENEEYATLRLYGAGGGLEYMGNLDHIKIHGNNFPRKMPYNIKLSDGADLLGMGKAQKWVLLSNAYDDSQLRNKIIYDFAGKLGMPYSPDSQWVDLYLNGEYAGLYLLCEQNEVHPQRVDLEGEGSVLMSIELEYRLMEQNLPYVRTGRGVPLRIRYSGMDEQTLGRVCQSVENAIYARDGIDPDTGKHWTELIDQASWTRKYLIEEVFGNVDGGFVSQFFFMDGRDPLGKVYAGPVWDYDMAMANPEVFSAVMSNAYDEQIPNILYISCDPEGADSGWYYPLYRDSEFYSGMVQTYEQEFLPLLETLLKEDLPQYRAYIAGAARMNRIRWNSRSMEEEAEGLRTYMEERTAFLNRIWLENQQYVTVVANFFDRLVSYAVTPGECLPNLPTEPGYIWFDQKTGRPVDLTQPVYEEMYICLREQTPEPQPAPEEIANEEVPAEEEISLLRLAPMLLFVVMLAVLCFADLLRTRRSGTNDPRKSSKIPS